MTTEIVIKDGKAKVVLLAESEFEKDLIEKIVDSRVGYEISATVLTNYSYNTHAEHRIEMNLTESKRQ